MRKVARIEPQKGPGEPHGEPSPCIEATESVACNLNDVPSLCAENNLCVSEYIPQIFNYSARSDPCTTVSDQGENNTTRTESGARSAVWEDLTELDIRGICAVTTDVRTDAKTDMITDVRMDTTTNVRTDATTDMRTDATMDMRTDATMDKTIGVRVGMPTVTMTGDDGCNDGCDNGCDDRCDGGCD